MAIYRAHWLRLFPEKMAKITKSLGHGLFCFARPDVISVQKDGRLRPFFFFWPFGSASWGNESCAGSRRGPQGVRRGGARTSWSLFTVQTDGNHRNHGLGPGLRTCRYRARGGAVCCVSPLTSPAGIAIEDCEKVTRQLQYLFEVENIDYSRLESRVAGVSIVRLKKMGGFSNAFAGSEVTITLKKAAGRGASRTVASLHAPGRRVDRFGNSKGRTAAAAMLDFTLADLDKARLVPKVDFRSRKQ